MFLAILLAYFFLVLVPLPVVASSCELYLALECNPGARCFSDFQSVHAAAEASASTLPGGGGCEHVVVHVGEGLWFGPWRFPRVQKPHGRITYRGAPGGLTRVSGGITVSGFSVAAGGVWTAPAPPELLSASPLPSQLFVAGGVRRPRARSPNVPGSDPGDVSMAFSANGTFAWASPLCPLCGPAEAARVNGGGLVFASGDVDAAWPGLASGGEVLVFSSPWSTCSENVRAAFQGNSTLLFHGDCSYFLGSFSNAETGRRWLLENVRALLDAPGEWFLDTLAEEVAYMPTLAEAAAGPSGFEVTLPVNGSLVVIERDGFSLESVTVEYWALDPGGRTGAAFAQTGAVEVSGTDISLLNVSISHGGSNCVVLRPGVARVSVVGCALSDCGAHGLYMSTLDNATDVYISDNSVVGLGSVYLTQPTGILLNGGSNVSAVHNFITNSTYTGISAAWMHGAPVPPQPVLEPPYRFNVSFNRVDFFGLGVMSDFGGIRIAINNADECFINGTCYVPTLVRNNVITRGRHFSYGSDGIYTDNAVAGVDIIDNVVSDVLGAGLHLHGGMNMTARNNILVGTLSPGASPFAMTPQGVIVGATLWPQTLANGSVVYIEQPFAVNATLNVFLTTACPLFAPKGVWPNGGFFYPQADSNSTFDDNIYWSINASGSAPIVFPYGISTIEAWRAVSGCDAHSSVADPLIADVDAGNFTLLPGSPALALGFEQIDVSQVGPRSVPGRSAGKT